MDGLDRELGWEDVGSGQGTGGMSGGISGTMAAGPVGGSIGGPGGGSAGKVGEVPGIGDAVTDAMVNHFMREFTKDSLSMWPQLVASARRYFNVHHGYVLRKAMWQLVPMNSTKKKSGDGELGGEKDWMARIANGLEVDIEEPDLYIPAMGFVTYILLCGLIRGLQEDFHPNVLSATVSFAMVFLVLETTIAKGVLFTAGAANTPVTDLVGLLGYKYFYLSLQLICGLFLGWGHRPSGFFYHLISLGLFVSCGVALWQSLRRLARLQPNGMGQECMTDLHKMLIKGLPVLQALVCWCLLPSWPKAQVLVQSADADFAAPVALNASGGL